MALVKELVPFFEKIKPKINNLGIIFNECLTKIKKLAFNLMEEKTMIITTTIFALGDAVRVGTSNGEWLWRANLNHVERHEGSNPSLHFFLEKYQNKFNTSKALIPNPRISAQSASSAFHSSG